MIASKSIQADGSNNRFLSDFIIRSEQFCRIYVYKYDGALDGDGTEDHLENISNPWSFPDNLYVRGGTAPTSSEDLVTLDKWDLVDNSIVFYDVPTTTSLVYMEVATTSEEFGDTLTAPSVKIAEEAAAAALVSETNAAGSEAAASTSETNSSNSAAAALVSETNAAGSEAAANTSETNSSNSAAAANTSETNSSNSETNSAVAAAAALVSETNAEYWASTVDLTNTIGNINNPLFSLQSNNKFNVKSGVGTVTTARATTGTIKDRYDTVKTLAIDEARFNEEGFLSELSSTNIGLNSEDLTQTTWGKGGISTITPNSIQAPDGTTTADKAVENVSVGTVHYVRMVVLGLLSNATWTGSAYFKAGERTKCKLFFGDTSSTQKAVVDLVAGTVVGEGGAEVTIEELPNDWYRVTVTTLVASSDNYLYCQMLDDAGNATYDGDGVSGLYVWGGQIENKPFVTRYIPTTTTSVTRAGDITSFDTYDNMPNLVDGFTFKWKGRVVFKAVSPLTIIAYNYFDADNYFRVALYDNGIYFTVRKDGVSINSSREAIISDTEVEIIIRGSSASILEIFTDKTLSDTRNCSDNLPEKLGSVVAIGSYASSPNTNSIVKTSELTLWDFPLSDTEIQLA